MSGLLIQLEQQLSLIASASVSVPLGLLASGCAALVVAALLVQSIVLKQRRSQQSTNGKARAAGAQHAGSKTALTAIANGLAHSDGKPAALAELPTAEQLARLISTRRSIFPKDYTGDIVPDSDLQLMLEAANWAPTHGKTEPWRFVVLDRAGALELVDKSIEETECARQISKSKLSPEEYETKRAKKAGMMKEKKIPRMSHVIVLNLKRVPSPGGGKMMPECAAVHHIELANPDGIRCDCHPGVPDAIIDFGATGYWSSWWEEVRESTEFKEWVGLDSGDRCLGTLMVGKSDSLGGYRSSRGPVADKVEWRRTGLANGH